MKQKYIHILPFLFLLTLTACDALKSKEVARIPINQISNANAPDWKSTTIDLDKDDKLFFWTDMNIEYEGDLQLEYQVQIIKDTDTIGYVHLRPFEKNVTIGEVKTTFFNKTTWSFSGSIDFLKIKETGKYTFRSALFASKTDGVLLKKADLVLKK
ncbi:hypothetical protein BH10BAC1_BH10BAC1_13380 [soil metagenome]